MSKTVIRNAAGQPWSKWKPSERFAYVLRERHPELSERVRTEYVFDSLRSWRWDYAWPPLNLAVEIDGFGYGHQAVNRLSENHEKQNAGVADGWRVLRYTSRQLGSKAKVADAVDQVAQLLCDARVAN